MFDVSREDITRGSLVRSLILLATPLVAQNLVQVVQQVVDTFWLGRLSAPAVAAVGLTFPLMALIFALLIAPLVGTQVLVSQRVGRRDHENARRAIVHGVTLAAVIGLVVAVAVILVTEPLLSLFGAGHTVTSFAVSYLSIIMLSLPLIGVSDALEMGFVGWGNSRAALYVNVTAVAVNVTLDPFLIFGWGPFPALGIEGAAAATALGYAAGCLLAVAMALGIRDSVALSRDSIAFDSSEYRELLVIGLPTTGQQLAQQSVRVVIIGIVATVAGAAGLVAYTVGARVASVAFIPASGLQQAAQSVIGQNLGANRPDRAGQTTWIGVAIAVVGLSVVGVVQWLVPGTLVTLFVPDIGARGFALTVDYLRILAYGYWAIGAMYLLLAGFNGARETRTSMWASLLQYWAVRLPIAAAGAFLLGFGVYAVFWAITISNVVGAIGAGAYYYYSSTNGMLERAAERATSASD